MFRGVKKSPGLLFLLCIILLLSCSSTSPSPTSSPFDIPETQPAAVTATAERIPPTLAGPAETSTNSPTEKTVDASINSPTHTASGVMMDSLLAEVLSVDVSGNENAYQFLVVVRSPDTGCQQYADWWEVVSQDGDLLYRRILTHSHVSEQPFKRSGGPVAIGADTVVIVRAHLHPHGYGGAALQGSVADGFGAVQLEPDFAAGIELVEPLPSGCGF